LEEEKIEISGKIKEFVELIEAVKPSRFLNSARIMALFLRIS